MQFCLYYLFQALESIVIRCRCVYSLETDNCLLCLAAAKTGDRNSEYEKFSFSLGRLKSCFECATELLSNVLLFPDVFQSSIVDQVTSAISFVIVNFISSINSLLSCTEDNNFSQIICNPGFDALTHLKFKFAIKRHVVTSAETISMFLEAIIDFQQLADIEKILVKFLIDSSQLLAEPYIAVYLRLDDSTPEPPMIPITFIPITAAPTEIVLSISKCMQQWTSADEDRIIELRCNLRDVFREIVRPNRDPSSSYMIADNILQHAINGANMFRIDLKTVVHSDLLQQTRDGAIYEVIHDSKPAVYILCDSKWPIVESSLHAVCTILKTIDMFSGRVPDDQNRLWYLKCIELLHSLYAISNYKAILRMSVIIYGDILPQLLMISKRSQPHIFSVEDTGLQVVINMGLQSLFRSIYMREWVGRPLSNISTMELWTHQGIDTRHVEANSCLSLSFRTKQDHIGAVSVLKATSGFCNVYSELLLLRNVDRSKSKNSLRCFLSNDKRSKVLVYIDLFQDCITSAQNADADISISKGMYFVFLRLFAHMRYRVD